jgi:hypothetical protein
VPANFTDNDAFPGDFFNTRSPGESVYTTGSGVPGQRQEPGRCGPELRGQFNFFSPEKTFAVTGSTVMETEFQPRCALEGTNLLSHLSVCVRWHRGSITPMVQGVMGVSRETELAASKEFEIEVALWEALTNAAIHGCENNASKVVERLSPPAPGHAPRR